MRKIKTKNRPSGALPRHLGVIDTSHNLHHPGREWIDHKKEEHICTHLNAEESGKVAKNDLKPSTEACSRISDDSKE